MGYPFLGFSVCGAMPAALHSPVYLQLRKLLVEARERAQLTQAEVAERLHRAQSFVSKYELGDRRLDIVEFLTICDCLGVDAAGVIRQLQDGKR